MPSLLSMPLLLARHSYALRLAASNVVEQGARPQVIRRWGVAQACAASGLALASLRWKRPQQRGGGNLSWWASPAALCANGDGSMPTVDRHAAGVCGPHAWLLSTVGVGSALALALLTMWQRQAGKIVGIESDADVQAAVAVVSALQLQPVGRGKTASSKARGECYTKLVEASGSSEKQGIQVENLEDQSVRQALATMVPSADEGVAVTAAEFHAGATVASLLGVRQRAMDLNAVVFELFCAIDEDCDGRLSASEADALIKAMRVFHLLRDDEGLMARSGAMELTEFKSLCQGYLEMSKVQGVVQPRR